MTNLLYRRAAMTTALAAGTVGALTFPRAAGHADSLAFQQDDHAPMAPRASTARPAPARIVVPFAAGGTSDMLARVVVDILNARLATPFAVENRADAAGAFSAEIVAKAAPDGRTLLLGTLGTAVTNQYLRKYLPYDSTESFAPVALIGEMANVLVVHPNFPARTLPEFVERCRALGPQNVAYTSPGPGSPGHLAMEYLQDRAGIRLAHAAQRPRTRVLEEVLAGKVMVAMDSLPACLKHIRSGRLRALGVSSASRWFAAPDLPTMAEQGLGDFDATQWWYVAVPAGTRRDLVQKLSAEIVAGLKLRPAIARLRAVGVQERPGTSEDLFLHIAAENLKWKKVIASAGLVPQ